MPEKKLEKLISVLKENGGWMTSKQLAAALQVTDRTIRTYVDKVNRNSGYMSIESHVRHGYRYCGKKGPSPKQESGEGKSAVPQTPGARCIYIIQRLLFDIKAINLTDLQSQIYVSGYSIDNDLKRIRKMLESYPGLRLVRSGERIWLEGEETSKRKFYKDLLVAEVQENFINLNELAGLYREFDLIEIKEVFEAILNEYGYSIHESLFPMLILHAGTSIERMLNANYVSTEADGSKLNETIEYQIAQSFFKRLSDRFHFTVKKEEVGTFALVIMGRRAAKYTSDHVLFNGRWINTKSMVLEALDLVENLFGIDFKADEDLIAGLKMHLHGLIERIKNNINLENILLMDIKEKYPLVFDIAICIANFLKDQLEHPISGEESGYIAIHIGASSERMNARRKYRTVVVLPFNQSFSTMCVDKISSMFGDRIEIAKVLHFFEEKDVIKAEPDLLLTSSPIYHHLDITTVPINLFIDAHTESAILQALNTLDRKSFRLEFNAHIGNLIQKEYYFQDCDLTEPKEIIRFLCGKLQQDGIVAPDFVDSVLKREEMSATSFVNAFAVPHALGMFAKRSTIAVCQLKQPIQWGDFQIRLVMLFAVSEGDQRMIKMFFEWISNIIGDPKSLSKLYEPCGYEQFIERIMD